jgi:8-oxo-dGTP pyrophosphatase MutT (NUDIX family)
MPREKSAGAIIFRVENGVPLYLILHYPSKNRKGGHWEFPKGHVEPNETEEQTVLREVGEETGLTDIRIIPGFKEYLKYFFKAYENKRWVFKLVVFFLAETQTKEIKLSGEHIGFAWLPIEEAIKKTTFKNSKLLLKKANEFITKTAS